jgi:hypothetical protein
LALEPAQKHKSLSNKRFSATLEQISASQFSRVGNILASAPRSRS